MRHESAWRGAAVVVVRADKAAGSSLAAPTAAAAATPWLQARLWAELSMLVTVQRVQAEVQGLKRKGSDRVPRVAGPRRLASYSRGEASLST